MADGSTQQRGSLLEGRDARQRLDLKIRMMRCLHLIDKWCHAVDTRIARRDHHDGLSLFCQIKSLPGTLTFFLHARVDALTTRLDIRLDELKVILIPHDGICLPYRFQYGGSDVFLAARTYACNNDFPHIDDKDSINLVKNQILILKLYFQSNDQHPARRVEGILAVC